MSGHSHFKNIQRKKEAVDQKRAKDFAKISRLIIASVREKGKDSQSNPSLKILISKARDINMPKDKIESAIKRGAGEGDEGKLESFTFEAYGPQGSALIIEGATDNKNRSFSQIRDILKKKGGKIAEQGSVRWMFEQFGIMEIENNSSDTELWAIEAGAKDIKEKKDSLIIYTAPEKLESVKKYLQDKGIEISSSILGWVAKDIIQVEKENIENLLDALSEEDSVENIYLNTEQ